MIFNDIDPSQIIEWKKEYWKIFVINILDIDFVYRQLSRKEYNFIMNEYFTTESQEDAISKSCLLWPAAYNFNSCPAGVPSVLAEAIINTSGFSLESVDSIIETSKKYRDEMSYYANQISCVISEAFPSLNPEEVEKWSLEKTLWYLSRAEYILNGLRKSVLSGEGIPPTNENILSDDTDIEEEFIQESTLKGRDNINPILRDPSFDADLLDPEISKNKAGIEILSGSKSEFSELTDIQRFMDGKL